METCKGHEINASLLTLSPPFSCASTRPLATSAGNITFKFTRSMQTRSKMSSRSGGRGQSGHRVPVGPIQCRHDLFRAMWLWRACAPIISVRFSEYHV